MTFFGLQVKLASKPGAVPAGLRRTDGHMNTWQHLKMASVHQEHTHTHTQTQHVMRYVLLVYLNFFTVSGGLCLPSASHGALI